MQPKGIHTVTQRLANGERVTYRYAWRGGPRLFSSPGTDAFTIEHADALRSKRAIHGDRLHDFVNLYIASSEFGRLADGTKRYRLRYAKRLQADLGTLSRAALEDPAVRGVFIRWRDTWIERETPAPRAADMASETLSVILSHTVHCGKLGVNRATRMGKMHRTNRAAIIWEPQEIPLIRDAASAACCRLIDLARLTGMRRGDCITIPWSADQGRYLDWTTAKSRGARRIMVPILPELRALLDTWERQSPLILVNSHGGAWTDDASGNAWQRAKEKAGIDKRFHDFRGTFATGLVRAGLDDESVAEIVGWSKAQVKQIRERYVSADAKMDAILAQMDRAGIVKGSVKDKTNGRD
ncbi:MAG: tyrosine-type recombinase/integrase [Pseudomonadota bacterium]